jgi:hypothetical protein
MLQSDISPTASATVLKGFMTPDVLAAQLGISGRTLARWHAQRVGPARCTVGKLILYRDEAVREWLTGLEREMPSANRLRR